MSKLASFEKINYLLRPSKQIERKIIIDLLARLNLTIPISKYQYIGMGSIYYFDFILMHKYFNINKMVSIDNKSCKKRFLFNKPYDFVDFENCNTSDYLYRHNYSKNSMFWLDYDGHIIANDFLKEDVSILGKNCSKGDIFFITINCETPKEKDRLSFLNEFSAYIPPEDNTIKKVTPSFFPQLVQQILLNMIADSCEHNPNKFLKIASFTYKDGTLMYTLGGIFTDSEDELRDSFAANELFQFGREKIYNIRVPNLTYSEKYYLDSNINGIEELIRYAKEYWDNKININETVEEKVNDYLAQELAFELSHADLENYIKYYRYVPQYFETLI